MLLEQLEKLLTSPRTGKLLIELTSKCNLRCTYCAVSQPDYQGVQFPIEHFDALTKLILDRPPELILVNGHGETTIVKDWDRYCRTWLDLGFELEIISNLAKKLSDEEIDTFARFKKINVSIDSADPEVFETLRRGAKFARVKENLERIVAAGQELGTVPQLSFSIVLMDKNARTMPGLIEFGLERGVEFFTFCNLAKYPDLPDAEPVRHVGELPHDERQELLRILDTTLERIRAAGAEYDFPEGIRQALEQPPAQQPEPELTASQESPQSATTEESPSGNGKTRKVYPSRTAVPEGMTRRCLDPWSFAYIQSDTGMRLCCFSNEVVGHLGTGQSLGEILDSELPRDYRRGLLTGDMREACISCWARPWVPVEELQREVQEWTDKPMA